MHGGPINNMYEYLLVAHPDEAVDTLIKREKQLFYDNYKTAVAIKTHPHITVANFMAHEVMEPTLVRWMQNSFQNFSGFPVTLNNYSGFPEHTIYLRVQNPQPFVQLAKQLSTVADFLRNADCPPARLVSKPHLSIARRLPANIYQEALADYSQKTFHETFMLEELLLLKRKHQYDTCSRVQVLRLQPHNNFIDVA